MMIVEPNCQFETCQSAIRLNALLYVIQPSPWGGVVGFSTSLAPPVTAHLPSFLRVCLPPIPSPTSLFFGVD